MPNFEDITSVLSAEEKVADELKDYLLEHIKEVATKTGKSEKELRKYIDRLMVV